MKSSAATLAVLLAMGAVHAAESALTVRATELQAQAQSDATTLATLPENTRLDVLRRSGAWSEVKTAAGQTGWVRMFHLKPEAGNAAQGTAPAQGSANPLGALSNLLSSGRTANTATVTTGVRGLDEEDLQNAQPNPAELEKLQKFAVDKDAAQAFARRTKLSPVKAEYLSEPAPVRNKASGSDGS